MKINKRSLILDAAAHQFAISGFAKASMESIATEAGVTKPAIYYHFHDKTALYEAVLCPKFKKLWSDIDKKSLSLPPLESLKVYIKTFGEFILIEKSFSTLFAQELAFGGNTLPIECISHIANLTSRLNTILKEGESEGIFKPTNPFMLQLLIVSPLVTYQNGEVIRQKVASLTDDNGLSPQIDKLIPNLIDIIIGGLRC